MHISIIRKPNTMKKSIIAILLVTLASVTSVSAQVKDQHGHVVDTSAIYGERSDSLEASVFTARQMGNFLSKGKEIRTEVISAAGLCKMSH